ncbi:unnamed protein product (macronuclear) [Paramecium tetraurelia]|uniref:Uncharacterized protein n=1 Tax=Paramecium tetraurelia TaxID=5888 RepID=A0E4M7_PARTE|nr:uncharacterized protein GSPATT00023419001 [Paramecium tetraurelia]CAK90244.1 unnamed protein product [Paramecium tetraurelia]|eukprot:XP_001457641.1 hypothetical protein (macronuclear) [Paramecium tetraurelia strain d4-2]
MCSSQNQEKKVLNKKIIRFLATPSHQTIIALNLSDNCESLNEEIEYQRRRKIKPFLIIRFLEQKTEEPF